MSTGNNQNQSEPSTSTSTSTSTLTVDPTSQQPKMTRKDFLDAAKEGHLAKLKECIVQGVHYTEKKNKLNALLFACENGRLEIVKYLIETHHMDKHKQCNISGFTPLERAVNGGHLELVKYLVESCRVDWNRSPCPDGTTVLHRASARGELEMVKYLVETCEVDIDAAPWSRETACDVAHAKGHGEIVQYLTAMYRKEHHLPDDYLLVREKEKHCKKMRYR